MLASDELIVCPGDALGDAAALDGGEGTYVRSGVVYATLLGRRRVDAAAPGGGRPTVTVERPSGAAAMPEVGDVVLARVTRISHLLAGADILVVNERPLAVPAAAVIRKEHVRDSEIDKARAAVAAMRRGSALPARVLSRPGARCRWRRHERQLPAPPALQIRMEQCFQPGDVVRALVASLGDARSYFLTTARDDLGVVVARSEDGTPLVPQAHDMMRNPRTGLTEGRKVARIVGEDASPAGDGPAGGAADAALG